MGDTVIAVSHYFDHIKNASEQNLYEDLTIESIKMFGFDMIYMPRESIERDKIFGEDIVARFAENYTIELYVETVDGFEGGQDVLSKFGLQIVDQATFVLAKRRFQEVVNASGRPMEGDLIYFPLSNSMFEVNHVEHENPFYQVGKLYSYKLTVELFSYNHEEFGTLVPEIDQMEDTYSPEAEIIRGDNIEIQEEADEFLDRDHSNVPNSYPTSVDDVTWGESDPFGDSQ